MPSVSRDQFEIRSGLEVVHLPTGAVFRAYPYSNTDDMLRSIQVQWDWAGSPDNGNYAEQIRSVASQLLLEQARREMERRKVHSA
jgi:hypothetical protein